MFDLKVLQGTLQQIEEEKNIPREKILEAIEHALAAAYKKDYGARGQIIRAQFNPETGDIEFYQVKTVVDDSLVKPALTQEQLDDPNFEEEVVEGDERVRFNSEHHMYLDDAKLLRPGAQINDEMVFPLDNPLLDNEEFGRVAAMTAKQVIMQKLREAEKDIKLRRYEGLVGTVLTGTVQKVSAGKVFVELAPRTVGVIDENNQSRGEWYRTGDRIKVLLTEAEAGTRGVRLHLSRNNPQLIVELFKLESPEIATGAVEIKAISREAGSRTKIAVYSNDPDVDPIGACVGQRGSRINAVVGELGHEKIDITLWSEDELLFVANALAPATVIDIEGDLDAKEAKVTVADDQLSLAIGKEGQNARLAARLTGWKIDISGTGDGGVMEAGTEEGFSSLESLVEGDNQEPKEESSKSEGEDVEVMDENET